MAALIVAGSTHLHHTIVAGAHLLAAAIFRECSIRRTPCIRFQRTKVELKSRVARVRLKSGFSQTQFATALGVSKRTLEQ
jgi:DNA-binding transcriptional regulator YiaG